MHIPLRNTNDPMELDQRIGHERDAKQRDRLRAVRLALDGEQTLSIAKRIGRSRDFVQRWCYAYRDGGLEAIAAKRQPGRPTKLPREQEPAFRQRMLAGPTEADGVCALRGVDAVRILEQEFGVPYTLDGVYDLLHRLGFSCLKPRPRHRKNDPQVMRQWLDDAPLLSSVSATSIPTDKLKSGSKTKHASVSKVR